MRTFFPNGALAQTARMPAAFLNPREIQNTPPGSNSSPGGVQQPLPTPTESFAVVDPARYANLLAGSTALSSAAGFVTGPLKFITRSDKFRNMLTLQSFDPSATGATILVTVDQAPSITSAIFRLPPGAFFIFDAAVPQNDLWVTLDAFPVLPIFLNWSYSVQSNGA